MTGGRTQKYINLHTLPKSMLAVYIPCTSKKEAEKIATILLTKKLIACANIFPINSMFWWKNKKQTTKEQVIFAKSTKNRFTKIEKEVKAAHSYDIPLISAWETRTTKDVERWLKKELK
jgi:periplasmic divalent cation tolerance protein